MYKAFFDCARLVIGIIFLGYASWSDLKTRKVEDKVWIGFGTLGLLILGLEFFSLNVNPVYYLGFVFITIMFLSFFLETAAKTSLKKLRINKKLWLGAWCCALVTLAWLIYNFCVLTRDLFFLSILTIPAVMLFAYLLYSSRLLYGGADAKALICLALAVPFYQELTAPLLGYFPVKLFWPYPIVVLTNGIIVTLIIPLGYLVYNLARGDFGFPLCFLGCRMDIDLAEKKFCWPLERVKNNKLRRVYFPRRSENVAQALKELKEFGVKKVWVTPKIPFIIPLFIGFILACFVGDLMYRIVKLIIPI